MEKKNQKNWKKIEKKFVQSTNNVIQWGNTKSEENYIDLEITSTFPTKSGSKINEMSKEKMSDQPQNDDPIIKYEIEVHNIHSIP